MPLEKALPSKPCRSARPRLVALRHPIRCALAAIAFLASTGPAAAHPGPVVINEIHAAPSNKTVAEEFVEIHNRGAVPQDLTGWSVTGGIDFAFPSGQVLDAGGFLAVAQSPAVLRGIYGDIPAVGPFAGRLANEGERIVLRNPSGLPEDEVEYGMGFPWPTTGGSEDCSIELIHPDLDNNLGGSWRVSTGPSVLPEARTFFIQAGDGAWGLRKGLSEASDPLLAWRDPAFVEDGTWTAAKAPFGYGKYTDLGTRLDDMKGTYSTVYLRHWFMVPEGAPIPLYLKLRLFIDDGCIAAINGKEIARAHVSTGNKPFNGTGTTHEAKWEEILIKDPGSFLQAGANLLAVHALNVSAANDDFAFDAELCVPARNEFPSKPTPGGVNSRFSANAPPQLRQLDIDPPEPTSGMPVTITVKATDPSGMGPVRLHYQTVDPGAYIRLEDPAYEAGWTTVDMADDGTNGDAAPNNAIYTAVLPAGLQVHRRLVRFRISAADATGLSVAAPYPDDPQPNFAYFVYNGVPAWKGASRPGVTPVLQFSPTVMGMLPVYHLIAREADVINSQYNGAYDNVQFHGTLVYGSAVYDHIKFENRGEWSTYTSGKNKWRFHLLRGHDFQARDAFGRWNRMGWRTMNFSAAATPWVPTNRGMAGLDEAVAFRLYTLAGVPSPATSFIQFRVIDQAIEASPTNQYQGDLWGLYLTLEHTDGRFLDERGLPDGNTYKIENGTGDKRNQGPTQTTNSSDYDAVRNGSNGSMPLTWWRTNVDLWGYYGFRAMGRAVNDMDLKEGWNVCQYHNPVTGLWTVMPWDLDMLYMPVTHWAGVMSFQNAIIQNPAIRLEFQARCRELLDLLFTPDQIGQIVDELAAMENPPGEPLTMVDVDEAMWNYNPRSASGHRGAFYRNPSTHSAIGGTITRTLVSPDHEGMAQWIKDFVLSGYGFLQLQADAKDLAIPRRPTASAAGAPGFPIDDLRLRSGPFSDPQGDTTFGAMEWRLAEVAPSWAPIFEPESPKPYEVTAVWESGALTPFAEEVTVPSHVMRIGASYRARVRMRDATGRWSRWSEPVAFDAGPPLTPLPQQRLLRITEVMYHPPEGPDGEFIEILNIGAETVDLRHVALEGGITFRFASGNVLDLGPGEFVLVVKNRRAFTALHGDPGLRIAGEYDGQLNNGGERIALLQGAGSTILDFFYFDDWWPRTDGAGWSLVISDAQAPAASWNDPALWRESALDGGSPGALETPGPLSGLRRPGDANGDGSLNIFDAVALLRILFVDGGLPPCEGPAGQGGNLRILDSSGDGRLNVTDAIAVLGFLFLDGPPPALGMLCVPVEGCLEACGR